ncbi:MAG: hypothetical protein KF722_17350, partial [Nitrospira sp.]|nr:hypothetical protein [Nitrospira sp.]
MYEPVRAGPYDTARLLRAVIWPTFKVEAREEQEELAAGTNPKHAVPFLFHPQVFFPRFSNILNNRF